MVTMVNENSTRDVEISFADSEGNPETPESALYSIIDKDTLEVIKEETEITGLDSTITITIEAEENIILNNDNDYEDRVLMVRWFYSGGREENENYIYRVENLIGVSSDEYDEEEP
ncbi:MAG: hypothetical protein QHH15_00230 [Candidatus Thermoplasmatota archaeon]|nr:hypothetical protein [Candidatus Thermoplasmatota archaeon]